MSELISFPNESAAARAALSSSYDFQKARASGLVRIAKVGASHLSFHRDGFEQLRAKNFQVLRQKFAAHEPDTRVQLRVTCAHASAMTAGRDAPNSEDLRIGMATGDLAWRAEALSEVSRKFGAISSTASELIAELAEIVSAAQTSRFYLQ